MAKVKGKHLSDKAQYGEYSVGLKRIKNRKARLAKHMKAHPNDIQAEKASKTDGTQRNTPGVKGNYPEANNHLRDASGKIIAPGTFAPQGRKPNVKS